MNLKRLKKLYYDDTNKINLDIILSIIVSITGFFIMAHLDIGFITLPISVTLYFIPLIYPRIYTQRKNRNNS